MLLLFSSTTSLAVTQPLQARQSVRDIVAVLTGTRGRTAANSAAAAAETEEEEEDDDDDETDGSDDSEDKETDTTGRCEGRRVVETRITPNVGAAAVAVVFCCGTAGRGMSSS